MAEQSQNEALPEFSFEDLLDNDEVKAGIENNDFTKKIHDALEILCNNQGPEELKQIEITKPDPTPNRYAGFSPLPEKKRAYTQVSSGKVLPPDWKSYTDRTTSITPETEEQSEIEIHLFLNGDSLSRLDQANQKKLAGVASWIPRSNRKVKLIIHPIEISSTNTSLLPVIDEISLSGDSPKKRMDKVLLVYQKSPHIKPNINADFSKAGTLLVTNYQSIIQKEITELEKESGRFRIYVLASRNIHQIDSATSDSDRIIYNPFDLVKRKDRNKIWALCISNNITLAKIA